MSGITYKAIEEHKEELIAASRKIWENPELGLEEFVASDTIAELLEKNGFEVTREYAGIKTALRAQFGSGKPVIGILEEFDALPGLSQDSVPYRKPLAENGPGHGCGHCLMAPAGVGALMAVRDEIKEKGLSGTIVYIATPAEETCAGKVIMMDNHGFDDLDIALCWHPGRYNRSSYSRLVGSANMDFIFHGKSSHAGCEPELGRSALDAVELTDVAANYLREHTPMDVRIHYKITNGGAAANVVPDYASVHYVYRALDILTMRDVKERLINIAKGAALMTGTTVEVVDGGGCYPVINNHVVAEVVDEAMHKIRMEEWSEENKEYAKKLNETIPEQWADCVRFSGSATGTTLHEGVMSIDPDNDYGSSDLGDVSYLCPTCFFKGACFPIGASYHTWQVTAVTGMEIGHKSLMNGARMTALSALKFLEDPSLVEKAWAEWKKSTNGVVYEAMLPDK